MLASVIAAFVYLRIVLAMYAPSEEEALPDPASRAFVDFGTRTALALSAAGVLFLGIVPWGMLDFAKHATQLLTH
jgi:NADH:ubiquinone oxidoreductase subunit 2 (subunit N)